MGSIRKHSQTGALFFDFRYQGFRCREYTALPDSATNRKKMQKMVDAIDESIAVGTFNYRPVAVALLLDTAFVGRPGIALPCAERLI